MKFMLMMHAPRGDGSWQIGDWSPAEFKAHIDFMIKLNEDLSEAGELVGAEGLAPPGEARLVRAGKAGAPPETDGPFPEAKEYLAGYWIVEVDRPERAWEIAARGEFGAWIEARGHQAAEGLWECYVAGPESGPDASRWRTELNRPLLGQGAA